MSKQSQQVVWLRYMLMVYDCWDVQIQNHEQ